MTLLDRYENTLLDRYLDSVDCRCNPRCQEQWGECCGACPMCGEEIEPDWEVLAELREERRLERDE